MVDNRPIASLFLFFYRNLQRLKKRLNIYEFRRSCKFSLYARLFLLTFFAEYFIIYP